jgi:peptidoglycan hydrolase CwlO-like protein
MSSGPDDPTRPLRPGPVREREVATVGEDPLWREELLDRLASLRTAVALLGVLAVAALGVALWALLTTQDSGNGQGASSSRVSSLQDRVDALENKVDGAPSKSDLSDLRDREKSLEDDVKQLGQQVDKQGSAADDQRQAIDQLNQNLQKLQQRVDDLEQRQQASPTP